MAIVQFGIIFTVQLGANTAAWQAGRAVLVSANTEQDAGYENQNSAVQDAFDAASGVMHTVGFNQMVNVQLYEYSSEVNQDNPDENNIGNPIEDDAEVATDKDIWVIVTCQAKILMPFTRLIFGDGAPKKTARPYKSLKATYLVHTPHKGVNNP